MYHVLFNQLLDVLAIDFTSDSWYDDTKSFKYCNYVQVLTLPSSEIQYETERKLTDPDEGFPSEETAAL